MSDVIFEPLKFRNLTVKNRIFRSNIAGRFDNYDGSGNQVLHFHFGEPYTPSQRAQMLSAARSTGVVLVYGGSYGATQGPRLETSAEIARKRRDGCDQVGKTGMH